MAYKNMSAAVAAARNEERLPETGSRILKKIRQIPQVKKQNMLLALLAALIVFLPIALKFDFYYDMNDDVLIKDILSGVYSGTPEAHTMQILYPLCLVLSLLYRVLSIPVFGVFLVLCQFCSVYLIAYRTAQCLGKWPAKVLALFSQSAFWLAAFGYHLVFVQYTVTAGMLASAAVFWMLTSKADVDAGQCDKNLRGAIIAFLKENIPAFILYWLAFHLRTEMAALLLPMAGVAGLCKWGQEKQIFSKENICRYLTVFGVLVLGLGISLGADKLAYSSEEWSAFREYFDSRTELYDYQFDFVIDYESNAEIYEAAGVTQMQQVLLENYNFGVDDSIDEKLLTRLKEEVQKSPDAGGLFRKSFTEALWSLCHIHWLGSSDRPYNLVLLLSGILLLLLSWKKGHRHLLWQVPMCYAAGSVLWMFLLLRDRPVDRVFHPLYLGQIAVFAGIWLLELRREKEMQVSAKENMKRAVWEEPAKVAAAASTALVLTVCAIFVLPAFSAVSKEYADREAVNQTNEAVMAYCMSHSDRLFLEDVYSTVYYSEKISVDRNKPFNYDLLGGWLVKSPLTVKKMSAFGYSGMGEAVLAEENVSLLAETGSDMQWLEDYFLQEGVSAKVIRTGELTQGVEIYQVVSENTGETLR